MATRARSKLNVKQVASLSRPGIYSDGAGLYLRVRSSGRSWFYIGRLNGKRIELGLGSVFDVSLAQAREKASTFRAMTLQGIDPRAVRDEAAQQAQPVITFGKFAMQFIDDIEDGFRNPKHRQQWRNTLETYAVTLFDLPVTDVDTEHVLAALQPIWLTKPETASRVRGRIERVLDAAKAKGLRTGENPARGRGHLYLLLPARSKAEVKHHAALPFVEIAAFMAELRTRPALSARALEFTILTTARSGEARGMTWSEVDLEAKIWTVPGSRMKAGEAHQVPLSGPAAAVLMAVAGPDDRPTDIVFPAPRGGHLSDMALAQLLKRMGQPDITVHGFRSTFRDWAGETTQFAREEVELALAHTIGSATERAYRRGRALEKRRDLMAAWSAYCSGGLPD
ncbi:integrase [Erythrobacter sp. QSSC1-22B]|uniref:tyrosine-type recombinase/integrase n=1 Tax=Erythrobacter sp. QSSC1-22B TaxID=1860125 RepID=UPI000805F595|nr:site-specific integrase [Erythrobacter sp. QSSC1-22B]OBX19606.1 integrase [Erythrobacter sp. QSSC1-22B]